MRASPPAGSSVTLISVPHAAEPSASTIAVRYVLGVQVDAWNAPEPEPELLAEGCPPLSEAMRSKSAENV